MQSEFLAQTSPKFNFDSWLELNNKLPETPLFFLKPTTSYVSQGHPIVKPNACKILHHEVELGVVIKRYDSNIFLLDFWLYFLYNFSTHFLLVEDIKLPLKRLHLLLQVKSCIYQEILHWKQLLSSFWEWDPIIIFVYLLGYTLALDMTARDIQDRAVKNGLPW